jgi:hypothetical protein
MMTPMIDSLRPLPLDVISFGIAQGMRISVLSPASPWHCILPIY